VHVLAIDDATRRDSGAKELAPAFSKSVKVPDGRLVSGIGWSAIVTNLERSARDVPMKLLQLHWAYIALYMEIDRGLLAVLDQDSARRSGSMLADLEADAEQVFDDYIRVMEARARVDSALAGLGGDEQSIWDVMAAVTKFDSFVSGVDRKVEVLQRIADRRVDEVKSAADRRTARILGFLASLALVTLAITLLGFFIGGVAQDTSEGKVHRYTVLGIGLVCAVLLWWLTFRVPARNKRPKGRRSEARR
jgi:hypothetical protein